MKKLIDDATQLDQFREKIFLWLKTLAGKQGTEAAGFNPELEILEAAEFSASRAIYEAQVETRAVKKINKLDNIKVAAPATILTESQIDVWSVKAGVPDEFVSGKKTVDIVESLKAVPCRQCSGTGQMNCPECMGHKGVYCTTCRGTGKLKCPECKGGKTVRCQQCAGTGELDGGVGACPMCGGRKEIKCPTCAGTASVPCETCGGKMRIPCKKCAELGTVPCSFCGGATQSVTGFAVEITYDVSKMSSEMIDSEIPAEVKNDGAARGWVKETGVVSPEQSALLQEIKKKVLFPENSKLLFDRFYFEKQLFYKIRYKVPGSENELWFVGGEKKMLAKGNPVAGMYTGVIDEIKACIAGGDTAGAALCLKKIEGIEALKSEAGNFRKIIDKILMFSYAIGAAAGFFVFTAAAVVIMMGNLSGSLHIGIVVAGALALNAAGSAASAFLMFRMGFPFLNNYMKRLGGAAAAAIILLSAAYGIAAIAGFNPARSMDKGQMESEYRAYFPFGMRTLANADDIKFLQDLIKKYEHSKVDLAQVRKDLAFMQNKIEADKKSLAASEDSLKQIEKIDAGHKSKRKYYRSQVNLSNRIKIK